MKRIIHSAFIASLLLLCLTALLHLLGCSRPLPRNEGFEVPKFSFTSIKDTTTFNLSVERNQYQIIPLETTSAALIGDKEKNVLFSESYILIENETGLQQFTRQGKYVRQIMSKGKGPAEYIELYHPTCCKNNLFFCDPSKSRRCIYICDLDNGTISSIQMALDGFVHDICVLNEDALLIISDILEDKYFYSTIFLQDYRGNINFKQGLGSIERNSRMQAFHMQVEGQDSVVISNPRCDTIWRYTNNRLTPICYVSELPVYVPGKIYDKLLKASLQHYSDDCILFSNQFWSFSARVARVNKRQMVIASTRESSLKVVKSFRINDLNLDINPNEINFQNKTIGVAEYSAINFKEKLSSILEAGGLAESNKNKLQLLNQRIGNEDNPVLILWNF